MLDFIGTCKNNQQVCKRQTLTLILFITILKVLTIHRTGFSRQTKMFYTLLTGMKGHNYV